MTIPEAAAQTGRSIEAIQAAITRGRLRATKRGRDWWIEPKALAKYIAEVQSEKRGRPPAAK